MNKEVKDQIDAMNDNEKHTYSFVLKGFERVIDIFGILIILFVFLFPNFFIMFLGIGIISFLAVVAGTIKEVRDYIKSKLQLR